MVKQSDYKETGVQTCLSVLLEVMTILGEFRDNVVVVGGNVPSLLLPNAKEKHTGTLDIDLALDFEHIRDDTYKTIVEALTERGYYQRKDGKHFAFYRDIENQFGQTITVEVDLLSGEYGGTGKGRRHQRIQDAKARKARGCDLVFDSAAKVSLEGTLPNGAKTKILIRIPSIGPYLVMKGMAIWERLKEKDAYDIYYCCDNWPGGMDALVKALCLLTKNKLGMEGLGKIRAKFDALEGVGPTWVADFLEVTNPEERARIQRRAFELVDVLMKRLGIGPFIEC